MLARNNRTSPYLWVFAALTVVPAVLFWNNTPVLIAFTLLFVVSYVAAYLMIVRFKVPRWLRRVDVVVAGFRHNPEIRFPSPHDRPPSTLRRATRPRSWPRRGCTRRPSARPRKKGSAPSRLHHRTANQTRARRACRRL